MPLGMETPFPKEWTTIIFTLNLVSDVGENSHHLWILVYIFSVTYYMELRHVIIFQYKSHFVPAKIK